jgi:glutamine amidotransferase
VYFLVKIAVIDYGLGNLRSIQRGLEAVEAEVSVTREADVIIDAEAIVLPGVGAFEEASKNLKPLSKVILDQLKERKPLLGICLGLQLLFTTSTEGGIHWGLNVFKGRVIKLSTKVKVPHIGWNSLNIVKKDSPLFRGVSNGEYVYFVHSYYGDVENTEDILSTTFYGEEFPSALSREHIFATQFHPEKSGKTGLKMLANFVEYVNSCSAH